MKKAKTSHYHWKRMKEQLFDMAVDISIAVMSAGVILAIIKTLI